jgi:hypothetical protein
MQELPLDALQQVTQPVNVDKAVGGSSHAARSRM